MGGGFSVVNLAQGTRRAEEFGSAAGFSLERGRGSRRASPRGGGSPVSGSLGSPQRPTHRHYSRIPWVPPQLAALTHRPHPVPKSLRGQHGPGRGPPDLPGLFWGAEGVPCVGWGLWAPCRERGWAGSCCSPAAACCARHKSLLPASIPQPSRTPRAPGGGSLGALGAPFPSSAAPGPPPASPPARNPALQEPAAARGCPGRRRGRFHLQSSPRAAFHPPGAWEVSAISSSSRSPGAARTRPSSEAFRCSGREGSARQGCAVGAALAAVPRGIPRPGSAGTCQTQTPPRRTLRAPRWHGTARHGTPRLGTTRARGSAPRAGDSRRGLQGRGTW